MNRQLYQGLRSHRERWNTSLKQDFLSSNHYSKPWLSVLSRLGLSDHQEVRFKPIYPDSMRSLTK